MEHHQTSTPNHMWDAKRTTFSGLQRLMVNFEDYRAFGFPYILQGEVNTNIASRRRFIWS